MNIARWEFDYVERFGNQVGLIAHGAAWTNAQLHERSCRLARAFVELGLNPGDRVALALPNCIELFVATSAVWVAGGVVVVMAEPPPSALDAMLNHCEPRILITRSRTPIRPRGVCTQIVVGATGLPESGLLRFDEVEQSHAPWREPVVRGGADVAQLCYTSGVTGLPKAAVYTHGGTDAYWHAIASLADRSVASTAVLAVPSTAFGARFIGMRIATNTRYILVTDSQPASLLAAIHTHGASEVSLVPTIAEQLAASSASTEYDTSSLRAIHLGGSHVSRQLVERLRQRFNPPGTQEEGSRAVSVWVHYGMTEAGGGVANTPNGGDGLVGKVARGVDVRIVDKDGKDVAPLASGEIVVRAPFAAAGYWNDEKNTAEVFRQGFVHTGDLGRLDEHGELWVVGRLKDVIIQGGYNVVPNEVIGALSGLAGVAGCAVLGMPNDLLGEEVVACIVRAAGSRLDEAAIRAHCRRVLDPRKQPARILFVDELPRTHNGKLDTRSIRERIDATPASQESSEFRARLDGLARPQRIALIAESIEALLPGVLPAAPTQAAIGSDVPFGELGLDSIGVVRMAHALTERIGASISPTLFYSSPTVSALSNRIHTKLWEREPVPSLRNPARSPHSTSAGLIAISGIGCRLPGGASSAEEFWELLAQGVDATSDAPASRSAPHTPRRRAAFVPHVDHFDGRFFRLASQAADLDPRHRMVLEVAWEALEDAGCDPSRLEPRRTGVFLGMYGTRYRSRDPLAASPAMAVAHLCQFLNLRGPVMTVDTTCSSSLVAVHAAVTSLKLGECDIAIVGGANLLSETGHRNLLGVMAPDGRSKAFDASADGFGEGEGCVLLILRRLDDAQAAGDRVYAVIRGTAINHDGRSSSLTAPNAVAQEEVIRTALASAGEPPSRVQYVEAHGTGTLLGDPIEVEGLTRVFGEREGAALRIGSLKTNIGHLEAAAGVAGVAKVALAIAHRRLPPSLHFSVPNPHIPWAEIPVRVQTHTSVWPEPAATLIAGVSSFGMSGTNAHAVLSEPPASQTCRSLEADNLAASAGPWVLPLSAASMTSLRALAAVWAEALGRLPSEATCRDVAFTASCGRAALNHRVALVGRTREEWVTRLRHYGAAESSPIMGRVERPRNTLAMVFSGQGTQWFGMGRELLEREPVFREAMEACAKEIDRHVPWRALEELGRDESTSNLDDTRFAQPLLFALQVGVLEMWRSWGVEPSAVVGHSLGEITAAYAAGVFTLQQSVAIVCARARLFGQVMGEGGMGAFGLSVEEAESVCQSVSGALEIAAINGPRSVTLSGHLPALERALESARLQGIACRKLHAGGPFHSRRLDSVATDLVAALEGILPQSPMIPIVSTLTGASSPRMDAAYWGRQCRAPVRFHEAIQTLLQNGVATFLEVGPHPALASAIHSIAQESSEADVRVVTSLRRGMSDSEAMATALGQLYCAGFPIDWSRRFAVPGRKVSLPRYQWDREPVDGEVIPEPSAPEAARRAERVSHTPESLRAFVVTRVAAEAQAPSERIGGDRSFESLGLDSLAMIRLRADLSATLGVAVPLAMVHLGSTVDGLVERLQGMRSETSPSSDASPLVWLRASGATPTWVWIHPVGGGVDCYRAIARVLPFRSAAIESPALKEERYSPGSLEKMAQDYLQVLQSSVKGPVVLAGWSLGGVVALEMAAQLKDRGHQVENLILIDSFPPGEALAQSLGIFEAEKGDALMQFFLQDFLSRTGGTQAHGAEADVASLLPGVPADEAARLMRAFRTNIGAARGYQPRPYEGKALLIHAASPDQPGQIDKAALWAGLLPNLKTLALEGDHYSLLREAAAAQLARSLSAYVQPSGRARATASALI